MLASVDTAVSNKVAAAHDLREQIFIRSGASPRARLLAGASALALILAASGPASAQQTQGGGGGAGWGPSDQYGPGGAGGTGYTGNPGGDGYKWGSYSGGGGGGAGGGLGGVGGPSLAGGPGPAGGVGGANGIVSVSVGVVGPITGSDGTVGGTTGACFYCGHGGGGGGAGGYGLVLTGGIGWNSSTITGGAGGAGGYSDFGQSGYGGGGGGGVLMTGATPTFTNQAGAFLVGGGGGAAGNNGMPSRPRGEPGRGGAGIEYFGATGAILENDGTITGGAGPGAGGSGAVVSNVTVINAGAISGGAGAVSQGKSIQALGGVNNLTSRAGATYSGAIDIGAAASLALTQTAALGAAAGTWSYNATGNFTGTGALKIATDPGYAVAIGGVNAGFTGTTSVTAGSELILTVSGALASSSVILEAGPSAWMGGQLHLAPNVSFAPTLDMQANSTARLNTGSSLSNVVVTGTGTLFVVGASSFNAISGMGDAVMLGRGNGAAVDRLTMMGTSDLTGQTIVGDGSLGGSVTLKAGIANAFSAASATTVTAGSVLDLGGFDQSLSSLAGGGTVANSGASAATLTNQGLSSTFSGVIENGAGAVSLTQNAAGQTLTLSGANTYTGATTITAGTLRAGAANVLDQTSAVNIGAGSVFDLGGFQQAMMTINVNGGALQNGDLASVGIASTGGTISNISGFGTGLTANSGVTTMLGVNSFNASSSVAAGATLRVGATNALSPYSVISLNGLLDLNGFAATAAEVVLNGGAIQGGDLTAVYPGPGILTGVISSGGAISANLVGATRLIAGGGATILSGANTYTGVTDIWSGAIVQGAAANAFSASSATNVDGALDLGGFDQTVSQLTGTGEIYNSGAVAATLTNQGASSTFAGVIQDAASATGLTQNSAGNTLTLTVGNTYTGATTISAGVLAGGGANVFSRASATTVQTGGALDLGGVAQTIDTVTLAGGAIRNGVLNSTGGLNSSGGSIEGLGGATSVTTTGGVTVMLGVNAYSGATNINAGVLQVGANGALNSTSLTTVANGATLDLAGRTATVNQVVLGGGTASITGGTLTASLSSSGGAVAANLVGSGTLTTTAGVTTLTGAGNAYSGATDIRAGSTLTVTGAGKLSAASATTVAGTLDLGGTTQVVNSVTLGGGTISNGQLAAAVTSTGGAISARLTATSALTTMAGVTTLSHAGNDYTGATDIRAGSILAISGAGRLSAFSAHTIAGTLDLGGTAQTVNTVTLAGGIIRNGALTAGVSSAGVTIATLLTGASSLTTTAGTTTLTRAGNDYTGATMIQAGSTLTLGAGAALSAASATTVAGALDLGGTSQSVNVVMLQAGAISNGELTAAVTSWGGSISARLAGASSLTTTGGTTILSNAGNNYTGATNVNGGTLTLAAGGVLSGASLTTIAAGGTLDLGGTTQNVAAVLLQGGAISNGALTAGVTSAGGSISAQLAGASSLTTTGGTTILSNAGNNYTGATNVNGGTLTLAAGGVLSGASLTTIATGGTLDLAGTAQNAVTLRLSGGTLQNGVLNNGVTLTSDGGRLTNLATGVVLTTTGGTTLLTGTNRFAGIVNGTGAAIVNNGTVFDDLVNAGAYTNNGVQNAVVASNSGTIDNMPGAVWNGHVQGPNTGTISNRLGAIWNGGVNAGANVAGGAIVNLGTWNGPGVNDGGSISNGGVWNGAIDNRSGVFSNAAGSVVTGLVTNAATATNAGTINALANVGGSFVNAGIITGAADVTGGAATNAGTIGGLATVGAGGALTTTGALNSGLVNAGAVTASGAISGAIDNRSGGVLTVAGALVGDSASPLTNAAGATLDVRAGFTNLARVDNAGAVAITAGASLSSGTLVQTAGTLTNAGALTATNGVTINGGSLISTGALTGALTNAGTVRAQGRIDGAVANAGAFVTTGALALNGQSFDNRAGGQLSFAAADLTLSGVGAFANAGLVTLGQYPARAGSTLSAQGFVNTGVVTGAGVIASDVTNHGAIHVGAQNAAVTGYELTVRGALSGTGTVFTVANLGAATANAIRVTGAVAPTMQLDVALARDAGGAANANNAYFGKLAVARFGGGGFTTTPATQAAVANAGAGTFYTYRLGAFTAPDGTSAIGVIQTPNAAAATAATAQTIATISALNASFFANAAAYLGEARGAEPNRWGFNVWNRNAVAETTLSGEGSVTGAAGSAVGSRVNTRLAGFQLGLDAGLFNIQNSGVNAHLGVTAGDVFVSAADRLTPGLSSKTQVPFFGAYGALTGKGFTGIVGVRRDTYQMRLTNGFQGAVDAPLEGRGVTFSGDLQYAMPLGAGFYVQPSAGVYLTKARLDNQVVGHLGTTSFGSVDSVLSRFGLKAGVSRQAGRFRLQMFAAYDVYREWAGNARTTFAPLNAAPGLPALEMSSSRMGGFQQASLGLGWGLPGSGWAGYARADMKFGRQVEGWGLSTGLRYSW